MKIQKEIIDKKFVKMLNERLKRMKEGRAYIWSCTHKKEHRICEPCCTKYSKQWYKLGKKDGRTSTLKEVQAEFFNNRTIHEVKLGKPTFREWLEKEAKK